MRAKQSLRGGANIDPELKEEIKESSAEEEKEELRQDIERGGLEYKAWLRTRYVGERDHGGHIHVDVSVWDASSEIVLVREGGLLKISTRPDSFD